MIRYAVTSGILIWRMYLPFLYHSCTRDAQLALSIAEPSGGHRQAVRTELLEMQVDLEQFRFNVDGTRETSKFEDERSLLVERARIKSNSARQLVSDTLQEHLSVKRRKQQDERE